MIHHRAFVHPKAHVDAGTVRLGAGTKVWQFASITRGTVMGEDCSVSPGAMLDGSIYGDRVIVSAGVACGAGFKVGNDVFLGPSCCLANDMWPAAHKELYDDAKLRSGTHFAVIVDDGATIGALAVVLPGLRIGRGAIVAAGAVVDRDVPDGFLWHRNGYLAQVPLNRNAKRMRWVKSC
ncbi:N-acetyltransferase [Mesorhizobium muleiense]|uniref:N-acetyltransferase n=1 Tax=Mesorhizobium muleiense TaxID=1004279 RepID=UPI001F22C374|nr:N-acetyltransferase [Mesorhizobium muleiense]MCF6111994.1 N-acetyltransferase [Mesorhizobium muleiense]